MKSHMEAPPSPEASREVKLVKGPNIGSIPEMTELPDTLEAPVLLKVGDDVSTDEILPAGARVLPYRSNISKISEFCFQPLDPTYPTRARDDHGRRSHAIVGGSNYGQGSSREHAALAPRFLGLSVVIAKSFARIHWQNLVNFGVLPLQFVDEGDYERVDRGSVIQFTDLRTALRGGDEVSGRVDGRPIRFHHTLSKRQRDVLTRGGLIPWMRERLREKRGGGG